MMGLSYWLPLHGTRVLAKPMDSYMFRSYLGASIGFTGSAEMTDNELCRQWFQSMLAQYKQARPFFYGDYYPLTRTSILPDMWAAYQLHRSDLEAGMIVMLRRPESPFPSAQLKLKGLTPSATYIFTDVDSGSKVTQTGRDAMTAGGSWALEPRSSRLVFYRKLP